MRDKDPQSIPSTPLDWWRYVAGRFPAPLAVAVFAGVASLLPILVAPAFFQVYVDEVLITRHHDWLAPVVTGLVSSILFGAVALHLYQRVRGRLGALLCRLVSDRIGRVVFGRQAAPDRANGDMHVVSDGLALARSLTGELLQASVDTVALGLFFALMSLYSLELVGVIAAVVLAGTLWAALRFRARHRDAIFSGEESIFEFLVACASDGESLRLNGSNLTAVRQWASEHNAWSRAVQADESREQLTWGGLRLLGGVAHAATLAVGGWLVTSGSLSIGALVAFQALLGLALARAFSMCRVTLELHINSTSFARAFTELGRQEREGEEGAERANGDLDLALDYLDEVAGPGLSEQLGVVGRGGQVAVVGPPGAGASRLAHLLGRQLPLIDEQPVWFAGSVAENLSLWDPACGYEEVSTAARTACVHEAILRHAGGYDEPLSPAASNFSSQQRYQLALARELLRRPDVLVVDRAFDGFDEQVCKTISANLREMGCTLVIVTSQPRWMELADRVVRLQEAPADARALPDDSPEADGQDAEEAMSVRGEDPLAEVAELIDAAARRGHHVEPGEPVLREGLRREFVFATAMALVAGFLGIALAVATGSIVQTVLPQGDLQMLGVWAGLLVIVAAASAVIGVARARSGTRIEAVLAVTVQSILVDRFVSSARPGAMDELPASWATRLEQSRQALQRLVPVAVEAAAFAVTVLALIGLLYWYDPALATVAAALPLTVIFAGFAWSFRRQVGWHRRLHDATCGLNGRLASWLGARRFLRNADALERVFGRWRERDVALNQMHAAKTRACWATEKTLALAPAVAVLVLIATSHISATRWDNLDVGMFVAFASAYLILSSAVLSLAEASVGASGAVASLLDVGPLWAEKQEGGAKVRQIAGRIEVNRLTIRPSAADRPVVREVTLQAEQGELVAILGPSGSGKSSLLLALLGLEEHNLGAIYVDGRELSRLDGAQWREKVGALTDQVGVPSGRLGEVLTSGGQADRTADDLAELVGLDAWVAQLPDGFDTIIGRKGLAMTEEVRRRVRLAQILGRRPRLLVLDEPTRGVEPETAEAILDYLRRDDATCIIATSDVEVAKRADTVVELSR